MRKQKYDVFISYRREHGAELAQLVRNALTDKGMKVFLDVRDLAAGHFDQALLTTIADSANFILILTPNCLERCVNEGDWLRREIAQAIKTNRNIIPLLFKGFEFPQADHLPEPLSSLQLHQCAVYDHLFSDESIAKLIKLLCGYPKRTLSKPYMLVAGACLILLLCSGLYLAIERKQSKTPDANRMNSTSTSLPTPTIKDPLTLNFSGFGQRFEDNAWREFQVRDGMTMYNGDQYRISFVPNDDCYVHIIVFNADNSIDQLFPKPSIAQSNFCRRAQRYEVPDGNNWFTLDNKTGTETMVLIASYEPLKDLADLIKKVLDSQNGMKSYEIKNHIRELELQNEPGKDGMIHTRSGIVVRNVSVSQDQKSSYASLNIGKNVKYGMKIIQGKANVVYQIQFAHNHKKSDNK